MKTYIVEVREVHVHSVEAQAESPEEAKFKVNHSECTYLDDSLEFSHTLDPETWTVREKE